MVDRKPQAVKDTRTRYASFEDMMREMVRRADELEANPERAISHKEMMKRLRKLKVRKRP